MARLFNGTTDLISATVAEVAGAKTLAAYVNPTSAGEGNNGHILRVEISGGTGFQMSMVTSNRINAQTNFDTTNASSSTLTALTLGAWSVVFATYRTSDKTWRIYVGTPSVAVAEATYGSQTAGVTTPASGATGVVIGNRTSAANTFDGSIAYVGLYTKELSIAEMDQYRQGHITPSSLQNFWPLSDPNVTNNFDLIAGKSGTATGTVYSSDPLPFRLPGQPNNYQFVSAGDGISVTEKLR